MSQHYVPLGGNDMPEDKPCGTIMAVMLDSRVDNAVAVQSVLTKHGCAIRLRVGLHETSKEYCANWGLILLQLCATCCEAEAVKADLEAIAGVKVKSMTLDFD
jgi:hypothetical protein